MRSFSTLEVSHRRLELGALGLELGVVVLGGFALRSSDAAIALNVRSSSPTSARALSWTRTPSSPASSRRAAAASRCRGRATVLAPTNTSTISSSGMPSRPMIASVTRAGGAARGARARSPRPRSRGRQLAHQGAHAVDLALALAVGDLRRGGLDRPARAAPPASRGRRCWRRPAAAPSVTGTGSPATVSSRSCWASGSACIAWSKGCQERRVAGDDVAAHAGLEVDHEAEHAVRGRRCARWRSGGCATRDARR